MNSSFSWDRTLPIEQESEVQKNAEPFSWENTRAIGQREVTHPLDIQKQMTREQFMSLPFEERASLSRQLGEQGQAEVGEALLTGAIPGLNRVTEYAREKGIIPEKAITPGQEVGPHLVGQALPFTGVLKGAGKLTEFLKLNPKLAPYITAALGTAGFESGRKPLEEGEFPSLGELAIHGGFGAASVGAAKLVGKAIEKGKELFGKKVPDIAKGIEDIAQTPFETAEETLNVLKGTSQKPGLESKIQPPSTSAPSLQGRITRREGQRIGLEVPTTRTPEITNAHTFEQNVLNGFPVEVQNPTVAGRAIATRVQAADEAAYAEVNRLYDISRAENQAVHELHPQLVTEMEGIIENIRRIPDPSPVQIKLRRSAERLVRRLAQRNAEGEIESYNLISNQDLIDQMQAWRQLVDYEFAHGDPHNIFRPAIQSVDRAATRAAEEVGGVAAESNRAARNAYREWTETFNEGDIRKFRRGNNLNFSQNFKNSVNIDDINKLRPILEQTAEGRTLLEGMQRELAEKELSRFMVEPRNINQREFEKKLRELSEALTPEQIGHVRQSYQQSTNELPRFGRRALEQPKAQKGKYEEAIPEDILKKMNSRSEIRELRKDLSKNPDQFEKEAKQKVKSILLEGNVEGVPTGDQLYSILNKTSNREILSELLGNEAYNAALSASRQLGKKEATKMAMAKIIRKGSLITKLGAVGLLI